MKNFVITTDTSSDLTQEYTVKNHVGIIPHYYNIDGTIIYGGKIQLTAKEFYFKMRSGMYPTTLTCDPLVVQRVFEEYLSEGFEILHISTGSSLSDSYFYVEEVAKELMRKYPALRIRIVDSANISLGLGMMLHKAVLMKKNGKTLDEILDWLTEFKMNFCVLFTTNNLRYLYDSYRISPTVYRISRLTGLKAIFRLDEEGTIGTLAFIRGRKKCLQHLVKHMMKRAGIYGKHPGTICVVHGDALGEAKYLASLITKKYPSASVMIHSIGPTVGSYTGPSAVGLCFMGEKR